jgi:membrane associated rhomboid family serine protease
MVARVALVISALNRELLKAVAIPLAGMIAGGLLAALGAYHAEERLRVLFFLIFPMEVRAKFILLLGILTSALGAVFAVGHIAHLAHLGGFIGGLGCALVFQRPHLVDSR